MRVVLNIPEVEAVFLFDLLRRFDFVSFEEPSSAEAAKTALLHEIRQSVTELRAGELPTRPAQAFLDELPG